MRSLSSRQIIKMLENDGWYHIGSRGSHFYYKHPAKPGKLTVPHPRKTLDNKTIKRIISQAGLE